MYISHADFKKREKEDQEFGQWTVKIKKIMFQKVVVKQVLLSGGEDWLSREVADILMLLSYAQAAK